MLHRLLAPLVVTLAVAASLAVPSTAGAQTADIQRARAAAEEAVRRVSDAESALGAIERDIASLEAKATQAEERLAALSGSMEELVVERYTSSGDMPLLGTDDINEGVKAEALARYVSQGTFDTIDDFTEAKAELDEASAALTAKRQQQEASIESLRRALADVQAELKRLEELEAKRRAEEEARRKAAEAEAQRRAAAEAQAQQRTSQAARSSATTSGSASRAASPAPAAAPAPATSSGGGMVCPVAGPHSFIDSWGYPRSGGRSHKGVDMMARSGVPVVAPVSGTVSHRGNSIGGLSFHLSGDNGHYYYGTHLSAYGASGRVSAGTVIGYVGDTGNARGMPHLHFEIHPNHSGPVNPYPATRAACG